jgi:hypothetical protein
MQNERSKPIDIRNVRLLYNSLYIRMEKEIVCLKKIASKHQADEKRFIINHIQRLEQEEGDYRRTGTFISA